MTMLTTGKANPLNNLGFEMYKTIQKRKKIKQYFLLAVSKTKKCQTIKCQHIFIILQ